MARFENSDVSFDVPSDWQDKTIVAFAAPVPAGKQSTATVVMTKEPVRQGETLSRYADRQLVELAKKLPGFELTDRKDAATGGQPVVELSFSWKGGAGWVDQRMIIGVTKQGIALNLAATTPRADTAKYAATFDRIFSSVKLDGG
ncbi:MAG: DcrB-related protein [Polyangiaceae bacterium]|nr:DcrB-related protein [Polyangiaceae bacterium]